MLHCWTKPHVVTISRHKSKIGFDVLLSAMPGLITLVVESISTYLQCHQEKQILDSVNAITKDDATARNTLQHYSNAILIYGRYNVET